MAEPVNSHIERARMVTCARFILSGWRNYTEAHPDHDKDVHFISRDSQDILTILCDSLLALIVSHRRFYSDYPLLPWLHSTEVVEHVFGTLRKLKNNFSLLDFLLFMPKVQVILSGEFRDLLPTQQANETAAGYHHTYFQNDDIDLQQLTVWPSDTDLEMASSAAFAEASDLLRIVGIDPATSIVTGSNSHPPRLVNPTEKRPQPLSAEVDMSEESELQTPESLTTLFSTLAIAPSLERAHEDEIDALALALAADNVESMHTM